MAGSQEPGTLQIEPLSRRGAQPRQFTDLSQSPVSTVMVMSKQRDMTGTLSRNQPLNQHRISSPLLTGSSR